MPKTMNARVPIKGAVCHPRAGRPFVLSDASVHNGHCTCPSCRSVAARASFSVTIDGTELTLANVKEGSKVKLDAGASSEPEPAPAAAPPPAASSAPSTVVTAEHLKGRTDAVRASFPNSLSADDFLARVEVMLCAYGFRGDNSIAVTNLCRDESTGILKQKIEAVFGANFNINGLGAVLTCGVTGMGAGLSHAPIDENGREKYVFFSLPHVAVDEKGQVGAMFRPGRTGQSAACGALITAHGAFKADGLEAYIQDPGKHDIDEPEFSILKQRLARRMAGEGTDMDSVDVAGITKTAERVITSDLEFLISQAVDTGKADYAVVTGVQIHSWPNPETGAPNIEFVMPSQLYVVVNGEKTEIDITNVPALTPRQAAVLATAGAQEMAGAYCAGSTVTEVKQTDPAGDPAMSGKEVPLMFKAMVGADAQTEHAVPEWAKVYTCADC